MFARLLLLFILLPLADLVLIIMLLRVHWMITVLWILVSGLAGAWYVRRQGTQVIRQMRQALDEGRLPTDALMEGCIVLVAGTLLITPGLITDALGFTMLLRPCRTWYRRQLVAWLRTKVTIRSFSGGVFESSDVIDATVVGRNDNRNTGTGGNGVENLSSAKQAELEH